MLFHDLQIRLRRAPLLRATLLSMGLLDEIASGFFVVALPLLRDRFGLTYAQIGLLFLVGPLAGLLLDPVVNLLSDRSSKRPWILGGLVALTVAYILAGNVNSFGVLLLAFVLFYLASGAAVGLSEAVLIDNDPADAARTMTRWTLLSGIGDLLSPLLVSAVAFLHLGWSALCWLMASLWAGAALILWPQRFLIHRGEEEAAESEPKTSIRQNVREALRDPLLLRWTALSMIPTMVDEIFLGFTALYLRDVLRVDEVMIGLIVTLQMVGSLLGLFALDRYLKHATIVPVRLLALLAAITLPGMISLFITRSLWLVALSLFAIAFCAAGWYPLAQAEAYARMPGRSGTVRAITSFGAPFEMALPGVVGLLASSYGILAGLGLLGLAPVLMLALVPWRQVFHAKKRLPGDL